MRHSDNGLLHLYICEFRKNSGDNGNYRLGARSRLEALVSDKFQMKEFLEQLGGYKVPEDSHRDFRIQRASEYFRFDMFLDPVFFIRLLDMSEFNPDFFTVRGTENCEYVSQCATVKPSETACRKFSIEIHMVRPKVAGSSSA